MPGLWHSWAQTAFAPIKTVFIFLIATIRLEQNKECASVLWDPPFSSYAYLPPTHSIRDVCWMACLAVRVKRFIKALTQIALDY